MRSRDLGGDNSPLEGKLWEFNEAESREAHLLIRLWIMMLDSGPVWPSLVSPDQSHPSRLQGIGFRVRNCAD